ncbi:MAG: hypothetical protein C0404_10775 [Verrucomicrobia bacterium]|nr:hypothetical protein [Verrucomicrobiota bacterium]
MMNAKRKIVGTGHGRPVDGALLRRRRALLDEAGRIIKANPGIDPDTVRHTLIMLGKKPIERLELALVRGRRAKC